MLIAFHVSNFSFRGTEVATFDYAYYNIKILKNDSIIVYPKNRNKDIENIDMFNKFKNNFKIYCYDTLGELETYLQSLNCRGIYFIKYGKKDELEMKSIPTFIHCVYTTDEPHGTVYAGVSQSVSKNKYPIVPHIITIENDKNNLRKQLNIPDNAIVYGRHGGSDTFNIPFVKEAIKEVLNKNKDVYFIFAVKPLMLSDINHERLIFTKPFVDTRLKRQFINTCDAMIHACSLGESFGISVLEFSKCNKPVITWDGGDWNKQHLINLGEYAIKYRNKEELIEILSESKENEKWRENRDYWKTTIPFTPENVMKQFNEVFLRKI